MASVNKVILVGNLGADPEVKSFQNGGKVCNLRIATSESWKDRNTGERQERTEWHTVAIFSEGLAGVAERFLRGSSCIVVHAKLQRALVRNAKQGTSALALFLGGVAGRRFDNGGDGNGSRAHGFTPRPATPGRRAWRSRRRRARQCA